MRRLRFQRAPVIAIVAVCALIAVSAAGATFTSSASGGPQPLSSATLAAPSGLTASCANGIATLNWTATSSTFAAGYQIQRATTTGGPYTVISTATPRTTTTKTDTTMNGTSIYYYVVRAYFGTNWRSANSNQVTVDSGNC
jgi:hypothetical protein